MLALLSIKKIDISYYKKVILLISKYDVTECYLLQENMKKVTEEKQNQTKVFTTFVRSLVIQDLSVSLFALLVNTCKTK